LEIANYYRQLYPDQRGLSERSFRRYCKTYNITKITDTELDNIVRDFVGRYGHGYGRALMQGSIRASIGATIGVVSQRRVSNSLRPQWNLIKEQEMYLKERAQYHTVHLILATRFIWTKMRKLDNHLDVLMLH